ncbi:MAG: ATP-binding protein [Chloroflexi bacterium]|nr:ATP-binding protein [Chloroflexota bacterium]
MYSLRIATTTGDDIPRACPNRLAVERLDWDLPRSPRHELCCRLAVDELLTNTISYGYDDDGEHRIELVLRLEGGALVFEIADDGRAFDPLQASTPDIGASLQDRAIGGLGIYLVRKTMDGVTYRRQDGRNVVTLTKLVA